MTFIFAIISFGFAILSVALVIGLLNDVRWEYSLDRYGCIWVSIGLMLAFSSFWAMKWKTIVSYVYVRPHEMAMHPGPRKWINLARLTLGLILILIGVIRFIGSSG
jgi:hypothetical protein